MSSNYLSPGPGGDPNSDRVKSFRVACGTCDLAVLCLPGVDLRAAASQLKASGRDEIAVAVGPGAKTCAEARANDGGVA